MRITVAALAVSVGTAATVAWVSAPSQAATMAGLLQAKEMSLVQTAAVSKAARRQMQRGVRYTCTDWGLFTCCTSPTHSFCAPQAE